MKATKFSDAQKAFILKQGSDEVTVEEICRKGCQGKDGGLAQVLQLVAPAWGNREQGPDHVAESRWRTQPAIVMKPENSNIRRSKDGSQITGIFCSKQARRYVGGVCNLS
jgi:hypothetical protein